MRALDPITVLFTHYGDEWIRGSETVLLDLLSKLDPAAIRPVLWCNAEPMAAAAAALGCPIYRADFASYVNSPRGLGSVRRYLALVRQGLDIVRQQNVHVLHANSAAPTQWLVPVARRARIPLLSHLHAPYLRSSRFALLLHQATTLVSVSASAVDGLIKDGIAPNRITVIHNGIDTSFFSGLSPATLSVRQVLCLTSDDFLISSVASLQHRKGHDLLLRAFSLLPTVPPVHLVIIGDGPDKAALEHLATTLGIAPRVHFLGSRDRSELGAFYRASDIFALGSRQEAFGVVLAEAGYFELPVVATLVGGIPEVVEDGVTGVLVPPDNPQALADAIRRLLIDPAARRRMGSAAKARVLDRFAIDRMVSAFEALYTSLAQIPEARLGWIASLSYAMPYLNLLKLPHRRRGGTRANVRATLGDT